MESRVFIRWSCVTKPSKHWAANAACLSNLRTDSCWLKLGSNHALPQNTGKSVYSAAKSYWEWEGERELKSAQ